MRHMMKLRRIRTHKLSTKQAEGSSAYRTKLFAIRKENEEICRFIRLVQVNLYEQLRLVRRGQKLHVFDRCELGYIGFAIFNVSFTRLCCVQTLVSTAARKGLCRIKTRSPVRRRIRWAARMPRCSGRSKKRTYDGMEIEFPLH